MGSEGFLVSQPLTEEQQKQISAMVVEIKQRSDFAVIADRLAECVENLLKFADPDVSRCTCDPHDNYAPRCKRCTVQGETKTALVDYRRMKEGK